MKELSFPYEVGPPLVGYTIFMYLAQNIQFTTLYLRLVILAEIFIKLNFFIYLNKNILKQYWVITTPLYISSVNQSESTIPRCLLVELQLIIYFSKVLLVIQYSFRDVKSLASSH